MPITHHPDCDGWIMHSVEARRTSYGTYKPFCPVCGEIPIVGSTGQPQTAISLAGGHSVHEPCDGKCLNWDEEE